MSPIDQECGGSLPRLRWTLGFAAVLFMTRLVSCDRPCFDEITLKCSASPDWLWARTEPYAVLSAVDVAPDDLDEGQGLTGEDVAAALAGGSLTRVGERTLVLEWQQGGADWRATVNANDLPFVHTYKYYARSESYTERRCHDDY